MGLPLLWEYGASAVLLIMWGFAPRPNRGMMPLYPHVKSQGDFK